jgi:hypothetical protein
MLAHGVGHVDDPGDDPDHGSHGHHDGLPAGAVGPLGPDRALLGPDHALGPAALVPAPRVPVQLGQDAAVHLGRDPVAEFGRDPLVDLRADAFDQALGQRLVITGTKVLQGGRRGGDLIPAIFGHHVLRTFRRPFAATVRTVADE